MAEKIADFYGQVSMRVDKPSFDQVGSALSKVKAGIAAFLALEAVGKAKEAFKDVVDTGGKIADASQKTGVAAEVLQAYGYAAGLAGSNFDEVVSSLGKLSKGLVEAASKGTGNAADGFKMLGISLQDPAVKAMDLDAILLKVADKFQAMPDGPKKTAAAMELFGKSGANLIPTLNAGADGLGKLKKEAKELGVVMSEKDVKLLDELGDNMDRVKAGAQGIKNAIVNAIAPVINEMMGGKIDKKKGMVAFINEHRLEIEAAARTFFYTIKTVKNGVVEFLRVVFVILKAVGTAIGQALGWLVTKLIAIGKGFSVLWNDVSSFASAAANAIKEAFNDVQAFFEELGIGIRHVWEDVVVFITAGIADVQKKMLEFAKALANNPLGKIIGFGGMANAAIKTLEEQGVGEGGDAIRERARIKRENETRAKQGLAPLAFTNPGEVPTTAPTGSNMSQEVNVGGIQISVVGNTNDDILALAKRVGDVVDEKMANVFRGAALDEGAR